MQPFKKGPVKMAQRAGVRIVPVSLVDLWRHMPPGQLLPIRQPKTAKVVIHPPIDTVGRNEAEILKEVEIAVNSGLPGFQQCDWDVEGERVAVA